MNTTPSRGSLVFLAGLLAGGIPWLMFQLPVRFVGHAVRLGYGVALIELIIALVLFIKGKGTLRRPFGLGLLLLPACAASIPLLLAGAWLVVGLVSR